MTAHSETRPHGRFLDLRRDLCVRLPAILAHRVAAHLNAVRVVNQPIENAVGGGGVAGLTQTDYRPSQTLQIWLWRHSILPNARPFLTLQVREVIRRRKFLRPSYHFQSL